MHYALHAPPQPQHSQTWSRTLSRLTEAAGAALVAGTDPVALEAYMAKAYWNLEVSSPPYLKMASQRGLGTDEFDQVRN